MRAEVEAAARVGLPLSEWRAEWPPQDQALLLALVLEEWDTCPGCAQPLSETTAKDALRNYIVVEQLCAGCATRGAADAERGYPGRLIQVVRKPQPDAGPDGT